jgi:hypothetical protein
MRGRFVRVSHQIKLKTKRDMVSVCLSFKYKKAAMGFVREKEKSTPGEKPKRDSMSSLSSISSYLKLIHHFIELKSKFYKYN